MASVGGRARKAVPAAGALLALVTVAGCSGGAATSGSAGTSSGRSPSTSPSVSAAAGSGSAGSQAGSGSGGTGTGGTGGLEAVPHVVTVVEPTVVTISTSIGLGSGVIYKADGTIVTDAHVVEDQQKKPYSTVSVQFADGKQSSAKVVGVDDVTDVAVIKADRSGLPAATFNNALPVVGALDVVIGSPLGLQETVTAGIISSLHRNQPPSQDAPQGLIDLIQTDAPISPGNSGGAVADADAKVIGLSEAYLPPSSGAVAIGFVTPSATVTSVADQILTTGKVKHAFLGIQPADISPQIAQQFNLPTTTGALVIAVSKGGPAAAAGIQPGDVITKIGSATIRTVTDLLAALRKEQPGATVPITVRRGSGSTTLSVTLSDRPPSS